MFAEFLKILIPPSPYFLKSALDNRLHSLRESVSVYAVSLISSQVAFAQNGSFGLLILLANIPLQVIENKM